MLFIVVVLVQVSRQGGLTRLHVFLYCFDNLIIDFKA